MNTLAADIDFVGSRGNPDIIMGIKIEGDIVQGDYDKFESLVRLVAVFGKQTPNWGDVYLDPKGGDVGESIAIEGNKMA